MGIQAAAHMKVGAILPWFGAKRAMASQIIPVFGQHTSYWEPFCGGLAVLLAKPACAVETVCDRHGDLINLAKVLQDRKTAECLYDRVYRTLPCEATYFEAAAACRAAGYASAAIPVCVGRAYDFFVSSWMGMNGVVGTRRSKPGFCVSYRPNGGRGGTRWTSAVESIPAWHERLRRVTILRTDGFQVLARIRDAKGVLIYVDPPYLDKTAKYLHDFSDADHDRLARLLQRFRLARVVVSYYDHPRLAKLYPAESWSKILCNNRKRMRNPRVTKPCPQRREVLLINSKETP